MLQRLYLRSEKQLIKDEYKLKDIDHIVYAVPNFEEAMSELEEKLGIRPTIGGRHLTRGTKNALLHLGNRCYLEVLGIDYDNTNYDGHRWMGVDLIKKPTITRWAICSDNIAQASLVLRDYQSNLGDISTGERKTPEGVLLQWQMTIPSIEPEIDIIPIIVDWSSSAYHPTDHLEKGCSLSEINLYHHNPDTIKIIFANLSLNIPILHGEEPKILITVKGKKGNIIL